MASRKFFVAPGKGSEALLIDGISVYAPKNLRELYDFLLGRAELLPLEATPAVACDTEVPSDDFVDVHGQFFAKRALEIAAAGGHNLLMVGVPGSGKTMLARLLPRHRRQETLEVTKIYSIAGFPKDGSGLVETRPFRSPHHTTSTVAMIGGGSIPHSGEVTLSHHGVLFLDELPEFGKSTLEVLRQSLEDGAVTVARVNATLTFSYSIILVVAMKENPCE